HPLFARHAAALWAEPRPDFPSIPWAELARLSSAASTLLSAGPVGAWAGPEQAIAWYSGGGWRMDQADEELLRLLDTPGPELTALLGPLRGPTGTVGKTWRSAGRRCGAARTIPPRASLPPVNW
ncbi:MAG: hypothetical protein ACRDIE_09765, partial [Chloroflexota bacterium]